jgi:hypothetical protein
MSSRRAPCTHPIHVILSKSHDSKKKYDARIGHKTISFGAKGMSDYTLHKDAPRKDRYIKRHSPQERWRKSGLETPGFWSRWFLWNLPSKKASTHDMEKRFCLKIKQSRERS